MHPKSVSARTIRALAEQAFRDGLGAEPGAGGRLVLWIHRHVLRFRLGPFTSSDHVIGWKIVYSDDYYGTRGAALHF
jgi:hypothetical protein